MKKRLFSLAGIFLLLFSLCHPVCAEESDTTVINWPVAPEIYGEAAILMDADTGAVLYSRNPHEKLYPASITKIMTGLLTVEHCAMTDTITYDDNILSALPPDAAKLGLVAGETTTIQDALYALLLRSANEVAAGLAIRIAGSEAEFAKMMTARAAELGAIDTQFANASGLHDESHFTTAYDMALIAKYAMSNPQFAAIWGAENYTLAATNLSESYRIWHRHPLLLTASEYYYPYAIGGNTGYTDEAGRTLVTAAEKNGMKLLCVIMKSDDAHIFTDTASLFEYGFQNFRKTTAQAEETRFGRSSARIPVIDKLYGKTADVFSLSDDTIILPSNVSLSDIPYELKFLDQPDKTVIATITYQYQGNVLGQASLMMNLSDMEDSEEISPERSQNMVSRTPIKETSSINIYLLAAGIAALLLVIVILVHIIRSHHGKSGRKRRIYGRKY